MFVDRIAEVLFASQVTLRRLDRNMAKQELDLLQFATSLVAQPSAGSPKIVGVTAERKQFDAACLIMDQITFGVKPSPQTRPALLIDRNNAPEVTHAGIAQWSIAALTQSGTGTVRMCPPLPLRSAITQCSSRSCRSSILNAAASAGRRPQPMRTASMA